MNDQKQTEETGKKRRGRVSQGNISKRTKTVLFSKIHMGHELFWSVSQLVKSRCAKYFGNSAIEMAFLGLLESMKMWKKAGKFTKNFFWFYLIFRVSKHCVTCSVPANFSRTFSVTESSVVHIGIRMRMQMPSRSPHSFNWPLHFGPKAVSNDSPSSASLASTHCLVGAGPNCQQAIRNGVRAPNCERETWGEKSEVYLGNGNCME